ncbi:MAG: hypothetical protein I3273_05410 [Candidatus Moeniiplasma glomeromycotorum]|nr:hypothetical protein [Candidatus Moeniiplasma glomeromycotorum]MCE8167980.1 hypothetical protein [Candidatus Moeniiplasma glomeromycotorum]MCE8169527.1 hypothetical protein [Candidatus Moeniiplasma glomeromycotorum]
MVSLFNSLKVQKVVDKDNPDLSSFIFQDLPLQTGTALGNLLRQLLLNHISGIAPLAVEITDQNGSVKTIFRALSGVSENGVTPDLILKLKEIIWVEKNVSSEIFCCELKVENKTKKELAVTAGDFQVGPEAEIKNPELKLAALSPGGELTIKLYCQKNWGYHEIKEKTEQESIKKIIKNTFSNSKDNIIVIDTDYSPLKGGLVSFQIEPDKFHLKEKLTLNIQSKGGITPTEALAEVLEIAGSLFTKITEQLDKKTKISTKKTSKTETE